MRTSNTAEDRVNSLLYSIHATTGDEGAWHDTLGQLRELLDSRWTTLASHHFSTGEGRILYQAPQEPDLGVRFAEHSRRNPWFLSSDSYQEGAVVAGEDLLSNQDLVKTDFYRDLLAPHRLLHRLCGVAARRGDRIYYVSLHREAGQTPFSGRERTELGSLVRHLSLALENRWREQQSRDFGNAMTEVVEQTSVATILVDREGTILYRNRNAEALFDRDCGLRIEGGHLYASNPSDNRSLREAIRLVMPDSTGQDPVAHVLSISSLANQHPTVLSVAHAGRGFHATRGETTDLVVITARNQHSRHDHCSFARQFDFTPAQARLGTLLFTGHSLRSAASRLHVSENTVRSHLKQIFQKTQTHSQMELVHLHSRICIDME